MLPKRCRGTVLKLAHDVHLGGHLGKEKTGRRLLRRFYWPTLFKDVAEFCRGVPNMPEIDTEKDQTCSISAVTNNNRTIYMGCDGYNWTVAKKSIG